MNLVPGAGVGENREWPALSASTSILNWKSLADVLGEVECYGSNPFVQFLYPRYDEPEAPHPCRALLNHPRVYPTVRWGSTKLMIKPQ
jgi:hypothetical protein